MPWEGWGIIGFGVLLILMGPLVLFIIALWLRKSEDPPKPKP